MIGENVEDQREAQGVVRAGELSALLKELAGLPLPGPLDWQAGLEAGAVVGRFELVRELGRGGFGVVWEAKDRQLGRRVAFKAVRAGGGRDLREERLLREAEAAARLSHPNIVTLHDVGRTEQGPYLVLELLEGETLSRRLQRDHGRLPAREALRIGIEIAKGVAHAHDHGVVHRDLKPANVFLCEDGRVKVLDFGMAHAFGHRHVHGGTPGYMAPEQLEAGPEDERTDVFAIGAMLFEMLAGRLPYPPRSGRAAPPTQDDPDLAVAAAPALREAVGKMLEQDPVRRPRDGKEVLDLLTRTDAALEPAAGGARRRGGLRWVAASIVVGLLVGAAVAALAMRQEPLAPRDGTIVVAVADFANQTGEPNLDGMSGLLITSLEQSQRLRVLTRGRLIELMRETGKPDAPRIDESAARAVGRRAGVRALLLASIRKLGTTYAAELRAVDPRKDEYLFTVRDEADTANGLLPLIDRLSERTRIALSEPDAEVKASDVNVAEAVTDNLEAYRHYFKAKDLQSRYDLKGAVAELRQAVEIDPRFALARAELANLGYFSGAATRIEARDTLRRATQEASGIPDKEGRLIRMLAAFFDGKFAVSRTEVRAAMGRYPEDRDVAITGAELLVGSGYYEDAALALEKAVRLAPDWDVLRFDQVLVLNHVGRSREALAMAEALAARRKTSMARAVLGVARFMAGDVDRGITALEASGAEGGIAVQVFLAEGLAALGRTSEALQVAGEIADPVAVADVRAQVLAFAGRLREGIESKDAAARQPGADVAFNRQSAAWYLTAAGRLPEARKRVAQGDFFVSLDGLTLATLGDEQRLGELLGQMGPDAGSEVRFLRAVSAYQAGQRETALAELRALDRGVVSFVPYFHGLVAAEAGQDDEAVQALRRFIRVAFWGSDAYQAPWFAARARLVMARSLERLGRRDEARTVLDQALMAWKDADADLPLLGELRALREQLAEPPAAR